jgi:hypothetical protein
MGQIDRHVGAIGDLENAVVFGIVSRGPNVVVQIRAGKPSATGKRDIVVELDREGYAALKAVLDGVDDALRGLGRLWA